MSKERARKEQAVIHWQNEYTKMKSMKKQKETELSQSQKHVKQLTKDYHKLQKQRDKEKKDFQGVIGRQSTMIREKTLEHEKLEKKYKALKELRQKMDKELTATTEEKDELAQVVREKENYIREKNDWIAQRIGHDIQSCFPCIEEQMETLKSMRTQEFQNAFTRIKDVYYFQCLRDKKKDHLFVRQLVHKFLFDLMQVCYQHMAQVKSDILVKVGQVIASPSEQSTLILLGHYLQLNYAHVCNENLQIRSREKENPFAFS